MDFFTAKSSSLCQYRVPNASECLAVLSCFFHTLETGFSQKLVIEANECLRAWFRETSSDLVERGSVQGGQSSNPDNNANWGSGEEDEGMAEESDREDDGAMVRMLIFVGVTRGLKAVSTKNRLRNRAKVDYFST
jgi:hypothetical protein